MEPLIQSFTQSFTQSVAHDLRELAHATQQEESPLQEFDPPGYRWEWHLPLGFVSLAAAGTLLVAAGGLQSRVQEQQHGVRKVRTHMHKQKLHVAPRPPLHS